MAWKYMVLPLGLFIHAIITQAQPMVEVQQGTLIGKTVTFSEHEFINIDKEIDVYLGVPYAEPPVRFEYPVEKSAWNGIRNATYTRSSCYQNKIYNNAFEIDVSEDCLYLNIYAPKGVNDAAVMVWIHGGAFETGSGSLFLYNGEPLSAVGDVIIVTINYRLSTFGFLTTGDDTVPGNYGMMDQVEALRWVKKNIHAFNGNKDKVTIFGESAGAASVGYHTLSGQSQGLFNQAIMQSGTAVAPWALQDSTTGRGFAFGLGELLGCSAADSSTLRKCLQDASAEELYNATTQAKARFGLFSAPTIDGYFLTEHPQSLVAKGAFENLPIIVGTNADESAYILLSLDNAGGNVAPVISKQEFDYLINNDLPVNDAVKDAVLEEYNYGVSDYYQPFVDIYSDMMFTCPATTIAKAHVKAEDMVYRYLFTQRPSLSIYTSKAGSPTWLGATHAEEISFVFGIPFTKFSLFNVSYSALVSSNDKRLSVQMMRFWTTFAKTGSPSLSLEPRNDTYWPTFTVPERKYKVLNINLTTGGALRAEYCKFWNEVVPNISDTSGSQSMNTSHTTWVCIMISNAILFVMFILKQE